MFRFFSFSTSEKSVVHSSGQASLVFSELSFKRIRPKERRKRSSSTSEASLCLQKQKKRKQILFLILTPTGFRISSPRRGRMGPSRRGRLRAPGPAAQLVEVRGNADFNFCGAPNQFLTIQVVPYASEESSSNCVESTSA